MIQFGDKQARRAYELELEKARAAQTSRWAVSPKCVVVGASRRFNAGEAITPDDLAPSNGRTPSELMRGLVASRTVIELSEEELLVLQTPATARYVVAPGRSINTSSRGIVGPGREVTAGDFSGGAERIATLVSVGMVIDRHVGKPAPKGAA